MGEEPLDRSRARLPTTDRGLSIYVVDDRLAPLALCCGSMGRFAGCQLAYWTLLLSLTGLSDGDSYMSVADSLFISVDTVRYHIRNIYQQLQVKQPSSPISLTTTFSE